MEKTYARISLGRMEDMEKAMPIFKKVLGGEARREDVEGERDWWADS